MQVRDAFLRGELPVSDAVRGHLLECPQCRELFSHGAVLGRSLAEDAALTPALTDALFDQIAADVLQDTGLRAWLRSRPTSQRFRLVVGSLFLSALVGGILRQRPDIADYPLGRIVVLLGGYSLLIGLAAKQELAPFVRHGGAQRAWVPLLVPFFVAFLPATEASRGAGPGGAMNCFVYGALLTLPAAALMWACDRDERPSLRSVALWSVALGLSANLILELHCPNGNARHLLQGHASIGVAWVLAWFVTRGLSSRRRVRGS
jgi:hypothetical protein